MPWGALSFAQFYNALWLPLVLFVHSQHRPIGTACIEQLCDRWCAISRLELDDIRYRMTTMPARPVFWLWLVVAAACCCSAPFRTRVFVIYDHPGGPIHPVTYVVSIVFGRASLSAWRR